MVAFVNMYIACSWIKSDTEDIVQELFLNIWKNRERIEIKENVGGYLYKMAKHLALIIFVQKSILIICRKLRISYHMKTTGSSLKNFGSLFIAVSNHLPGRCKEVLLLHRIKGLKQKEISEKLDVSIKND